MFTKTILTLTLITMKPTKTQKAVIDAVIEQLKFWRSTNDINSPTHYSDIYECYKPYLDDYLSEEEIEQLRSETCNLFTFIKSLAI